MKYLKYFSIVLLLFAGCVHQSPKPWTIQEKALAVASMAAAAADVYTTMDALEKPGIHETNPLYGDHPSDGRLVGTMAVSQLLFFAICYYVDEWRPWLLGGKTAVHAGFAINNMQ